jgi:chemotaxis protein CheD
MLLEERSAVDARFMVGMAELAVSRDPKVTLCTFPLGSCFGIALYDPVAKVGGLLHSLLPSSTIDPKRATARPGIFLDTGLAALFSRATQLKAKAENIQIFAAGGSQIIDEASLFNIGKRNYDVLVEVLNQLGLKICAQEIGGKTNCSMEVILATGEVRLKYSGQPASKILCKRSMIT